MHAAVLRYFEAVAEDGSIRRASERLHISPSAVNRQILKLEDYLGTPLFERRPDGMRLTDAGQLVLRHAQTTLHDFARLRGDIDKLRGVVSGDVTITTLDSLNVQFLPEALAEFIAVQAHHRLAACMDLVKLPHRIAHRRAVGGREREKGRRHSRRRRTQTLETAALHQSRETHVHAGARDLLQQLRKGPALLRSQQHVQCPVEARTHT